MQDLYVASSYDSCKKHSNSYKSLRFTEKSKNSTKILCTLYPDLSVLFFFFFCYIWFILSQYIFFYWTVWKWFADMMPLPLHTLVCLIRITKWSYTAMLQWLRWRIWQTTVISGSVQISSVVPVMFFVRKFRIMNKLSCLFKRIQVIFFVACSSVCVCLMCLHGWIQVVYFGRNTTGGMYSL